MSQRVNFRAIRHEDRLRFAVAGCRPEQARTSSEETGVDLIREKIVVQDICVDWTIVPNLFGEFARPFCERAYALRELRSLRLNFHFLLPLSFHRLFSV